MHLAHGQRRRQLRRLQHDADPLAQRRAAVLRVDAEHRHVAAVARAVALEDLDRRRLAGAVRAEQAEHLALLDGEADPRDRLDVAVALAQLAHRRAARHAMSSSSAMPATGKPGSRPISASAISEQSGWWPTVATGPGSSASARDQRVGRGARRERLLDAHRRARRRRDLGGGLPRAEQRAREDEPRRRRRAQRAAPRAPAPARRPRRSARAARRARPARPGHAGRGRRASARRIGVTRLSRRVTPATAWRARRA